MQFGRLYDDRKVRNFIFLSPFLSDYHLFRGFSNFLIEIFVVARESVKSISSIDVAGNIERKKVV